MLFLLSFSLTIVSYKFFSIYVSVNSTSDATYRSQQDSEFSLGKGIFGDHDISHIPSQGLDRPEALVFRTIPNCVERKVIEQNVEIKLSESIRNTQLTTYNASYIQSV